jgi:hypothetical protein
MKERKIEVLGKEFNVYIYSLIHYINFFQSY